MDPIRSLDEFIRGYESEDRELEKQIEELQSRRMTVIGEVEILDAQTNLARDELRKIEEALSAKLDSRHRKFQVYCSKRNDMSARIMKPKKPKLEEEDEEEKDDEYNVGNQTKKKTMIKRFELSRRPIMTMEQIRRRLEGLQMTAGEIRERTGKPKNHPVSSEINPFPGLGDKKSRALAKLNMGKDCLHTQKVLTQMLNELNEEAENPMASSSNLGARNKRIVDSSESESNDEKDERTEQDGYDGGSKEEEREEDEDIFC